MKHASLLALIAALPLSLLAGPGAHGPNGEHLDAPAGTVAVARVPRVEAATEAFELVATLHADRLAVFIDRFASNEPVLGASLRVESDGLAADARFDEAQGDYALTDPKLLARLRAAGEHALVFTLSAGDDADLLDAVLKVGASDLAQPAAPGLPRTPLLLGAAGLLAFGAGTWWWRRRSAKGGF